MINLKNLGGLVLALALSHACTPPTNKTEETKEDPMSETMYVKDPHSYSNPTIAAVDHLDLTLAVDFENHKLKGTATWNVVATEDATEIIFDVYDLEIHGVLVDGDMVEFNLGEHHEEFGQSLSIPISGETKQVTISYTTGEEARALQFLDAQQTAGKKLPFLFTQSQAILARSWVPTQDSPGIRFTYKAEVTVPENMMALMSATNPTEINETRVYQFEMAQPIPSYLLALAVGDVRFESVGARTGIYAEPSILDKATYEFADVEQMVVSAEALYGPYAWERYDLIVLPPSFPFGGMENPRLTFATPTILAGDRSLVSLVAHELAHSWSGNLVTNATWSDFWLNEGFTVYFEQRIMEAVYGRDYSEMLASLTRDGLVEFAAEMMETAPNDTKLKLDLDGRNPDDGVTAIPYDKGYFFLRLIEETAGRERFDNFLKEYFNTYKFKVMTTEAFLAHLKASLLTEEEWSTIGVEQWVYNTGIPENLPTVSSNRFAEVDGHLATFLAEGTLPEASITDGYTTHEWLHLINALPSEVTTEQLAALDAAYGFTQSGNSEISAAWFQPTLRGNYEVVYPKVEQFLIEVGRRKFLTPTYRALLESDKAEMANEIYVKARPNYHAVSRNTMDALLGFEG